MVKKIGKILSFIQKQSIFTKIVKLLNKNLYQTAQSRANSIQFPLSKRENITTTSKTPYLHMKQGTFSGIYK